MVFEEVIGAVLVLESLLQPCFGPDGTISKQCPPLDYCINQQG